MGRGKIVLFYPRTLHEKNYRYYHVPYSLLAVASSLDLRRYEVIVIDDNVSQKVHYRSDLLAWKSDLLCVGISSMIGAQIRGAIEFAKAVRGLGQNIPIIWGGALPTVLPEQTASHWCVDIAVRGQGEITFPELVERLNAGSPVDGIKGISYRGKDGEMIHSPPRPFVDLNAFPPYTKVYSLLNLENYIWNDEYFASRTISYHSSQGCPFNCGFCCEVSLWHRWWSGLYASRILEDIEYLVKRFDVNGIKFYDNEFFIDLGRALNFAQGLLDQGFKIRWGASIHPGNLYRMTDEQLDFLHRGGLVRILVGAESGVQQELNLIGKNIDKSVIFEVARRCARHGIVISFTYVSGYPSMTSSYIDETLTFAEELSRAEPMHEHKIHFYAPYPGAPLYQRALDCGFKPPMSLEEWSRYDYYDITTPWVDRKYVPIFRKFNETHYPYLHPFQMRKPKMLDEYRYDFTLRPSPPFNFDGTMHKPSHFPSSDNAYEEGHYWQTMRFDGQILGINMSNKGSVDEPEVKLSVFSANEVSSEQLKRIANEIEYRSDMKADIAEFYHDCGHDSLLEPVLARWRGMRVSANVSLYEFLVVTTVLQNATVRRSVQMLENLFLKYGSRASFDNKELSVFWLPERIHIASEEELRALKIGYRAKTLKRQAQAFSVEKIDEFHLRTLPTDKLKAALLQLYGVGPASVWYLLFEVFKRYDALEYISPWEQRIYSRLLFNKELVDSKTILDEVNTRWGKWRMLAVHYLFEDLFWQRKTQPVPWLEGLIRL